MITLQIDIPFIQIKNFCHRWGIREFGLFGSVLRDDFNQNSDIDVLVSFDKGLGISLFDIAQMKIELELIFKRPVDILEKEALRNHYRKKQILETVQVIYGA
jgi:predicted nucleotidyltransferase